MLVILIHQKPPPRFVRIRVNIDEVCTEVGYRLEITSI